jgi:phosphate uptake regulator
MGKIMAIITSGFGLISAGKWLNKARKVMGIIRKFFKESREAYRELRDVRPSVEAAYCALKTIRTQNEAEKEKTYQLLEKAFDDTLEFIDEADDVWQLIKDLKAIK